MNYSIGRTMKTLLDLPAKGKTFASTYWNARKRVAGLSRYSGVDALTEHMLSGECVTLVEALMLFGVQSLSVEIYRLKREGFKVKTRRIPFTKALVRLKKHMVIEPPKDLPHKEIMVTEYWIEQ